MERVRSSASPLTYCSACERKVHRRMLAVKGKGTYATHLSALAVSMLLLCSNAGPVGAQQIDDPANVPSDIKAILDKPLYKGAIWGLRVVDLEDWPTAD